MEPKKLRAAVKQVYEEAVTRVPRIQKRVRVVPRSRRRKRR